MPSDERQVGSATSVAADSLRSVKWVAAERWGARLSSLAVFAVLGRLLAPEDFGLVALANVFVVVMLTFVDFGFSRALVQRKDLEHKHSDAAFWAGIFSSLALTGGLLILAGPLSRAFDEPELKLVLVLLSLSMPLVALAAVPAALLERKFEFRVLALRRLSGTLTGAFVGVALAFAGAGPYALVGQSLTSTLVGLVVLWTATPWRPHLTLSLPHLRALLGLGAGVVLIQLLGVLNSEADRLLIGAYLGTAALGVYFVGFRILTLLMDMLTSVVSTISFTAFSRLQDDRTQLLSAFYRVTSVSAVIAIPLIALAAAAAPFLIPAVFGPQWQDSVLVMQLLAPYAALNAVAFFDRSVLLATGHVRQAVILAGGQALLGLVLLLIAVRYGLMAVAAAVTIRQYAYWPIRLLILRRCVQLDVPKYLRQWAPPAAASLAAAIVCGSVRSLGLGREMPDLFSTMTGLVVGAAAYVVLLRWFRPRAHHDVFDLLRRAATRGTLR